MFTLLGRAAWPIAAIFIAGFGVIGINQAGKAGKKIGESLKDAAVPMGIGLAVFIMVFLIVRQTPKQTQARRQTRAPKKKKLVLQEQ